MLLAMALLDAFVKLAPVMIPVIQDALDHGVDPATLNWQVIYGRSLETLRAEVDAERPREGST